MLARSATIFKWTLYTLAGLVWAVVQAAFLQRVTIWGVIPFLYPLIAALPATFEGPAAGTVYALACGVFCDLLLPSSIPCFYTLILPLVGLAAGLLSQSLIPQIYNARRPIIIAKVLVIDVDAAVDDTDQDIFSRQIFRGSCDGRDARCRFGSCEGKRQPFWFFNVFNLGKSRNFVNPVFGQIQDSIAAK